MEVCEFVSVISYGEISIRIFGPFGDTKSFTYRPDGKLATTNSGPLSVSYFYDASGRRVAKQMSQAGHSFFGAFDTKFTQSYGYLVDQDKILIAQAGDGSQSLYLDGEGIDEHLASVSPTGSQVYEVDHLGSVLNSDIAGPLHQYGAFGESTGTPGGISKSSAPVDYGFAGGQFDAESGQYYSRARMYSPELGRFTTADPIGFAAGDPNFYRYAFNRPTVMNDPTGTDPAEALACEVAERNRSSAYVNQITALHNQLAATIDAQIANLQKTITQLSGTECPPGAQFFISELNHQISLLQQQEVAANREYLAALSANAVETAAILAGCAALAELP